MILQVIFSILVTILPAVYLKDNKPGVGFGFAVATLGKQLEKRAWLFPISLVHYEDCSAGQRQGKLKDSSFLRDGGHCALPCGRFCLAGVGLRVRDALFFKLNSPNFCLDLVKCLVREIFGSPRLVRARHMGKLTRSAF
jgi:hypothetical protein